MTTFFLDAARWLLGPHPQPLTPEMAEAAGEAVSISVFRHVFSTMPRAGAHCWRAPGWTPRGLTAVVLGDAALDGYTSIVQLLLADGRADPGVDDE